MNSLLFYKNIGGIFYKFNVCTFGMLLIEILERKSICTTLKSNVIYDRYDRGENVDMGVCMEDNHGGKKKIGVLNLNFP